MAHEHVAVLAEEVLDALEIDPEGAYLDATYGRGGHSAALLERLGDNGRLLVIDRDPDAIARARETHGADERVTIRHGEFQDVGEIAQECGLRSGLAGALFDLGVSSPQIDDPSRGFSFTHDGPLDMRMSRSGRSAADWLATVSERELANTLYRYGDERQSRRIAKDIVAARADAPIRTTRQLAAIVERTIRHRPGRIHPATRTFQAIRIAVNDELGQLRRALEAVVDCLRPGGRLVVISFHSLEDRIVKRFFKSRSEVAAPYRGLPDVPAHAKPDLVRIGGLVRPGDAELARNPRARSSRLRVAEKVAS